jgi:hypothetical protein
MPNNLMYKKLLERMMVDRPDLAQYAEVFQQFEDNDEETVKMEEHIKDLEKRVRKSSAIALRLEEDLNDALDELEDLAKALGACIECWGEDKRCPTCRGRGVPGYQEPDRALFNQLVLPALQKVSWLEIKER